jgi:hypothetical protein
MALLHRAELRPTKLELLDGWAPTQPWFEGDAAGGFATVASFRLDDPEGKVGIETLLVRAGGGPLLQVPLTYREAALERAQVWLIGTMHHSVLGQRWVYDATGDPAYVGATVGAILTGGHQAELLVDVDGELVRREPTALVSGSGTATGAPAAAELTSMTTRHDGGLTTVAAGDLRLVVLRGLEGVIPLAEGAETLSGTWTDHPERTTLAALSPLVE